MVNRSETLVRTCLEVAVIRILVSEHTSNWENRGSRLMTEVLIMPDSGREKSIIEIVSSLIGCVGAILAAFVGGVFVLMGAGVIQLSIGPASSSTPGPAVQPERTAVETPSGHAESEANPTATPSKSAPTAGASHNTLRICGEPAFGGDLQTSEPVFRRPEGCLSGWISSDPSTVVLPDGTTRPFETQYLLIVEDLPAVQIQGVPSQAGKTNTWGCWYSADLSASVAEEAKTDLCAKKIGGNFAVMYRVSSSGFEELGTTATVSCP